MKLDKVRWGIIGCGNVTEVKSGPGLQKAEHSELVAVMRRKGDLARDYAQRHGVKRWYNDANALINDPEVNAVYIATPPSSHLEYALKVAQAGKAVYVEKPMALNYGECLEMLEACQAAEVPLFVAYYRRGLAKFKKIKALIDDGAIGEVRSVNISMYGLARPAEPGNEPWRVKPEISGGGHFVDLASHMLDFLDYALGPIQAARGFASNQARLYRAEDIVTGTFLFSSGVHGTGTWCFSSFERRDHTEILGSKGRLDYVTFDDSPVRLTTQTGTEEFSLPYPPHVQQPLIQSIVSELRGEGLSPSSGESAARTSKVMDALLAEYYQS
ncbi:MAG: Gfo/Idh/MocA family oxidoreductase [Trueperaceae bacterium]|nr:Gfo/Idh/MocA family oxidoreductase [Trueperaceae bacterium]